MLVAPLFIYCISLGIQFRSLSILRHIFLKYQKKWLGNLVLVISLIIILIQHFYYFINTQDAQLETVGLFLLANSFVIYAITLCIDLAFTKFDFATKNLINRVNYDSLTKVLSREVIFAKCEYELARAIRLGEPISILTIDMDHFKEINDDFGHPIGDEVLIHSTNYCKALLRKIDLIGRIGGDEFIVFLPNTNTASAKKVAKKLKNKMKNIIHDLSIKTDRPISLSIGIASYDPYQYRNLSNPKSPKLLLKKLVDLSDKALYQAKKNGRNQYAVFVSNPSIFKIEKLTLP